MVFLQEKNISPTYAAKIYKKYGNRSVAVLIENPYRLADDIWGIGFKVADTIAQNMGFALDSLKRITSALLYTVGQNTSQGHLYQKIEELKEKTARILELDDQATAHKLKLGLHELYNTDKIKVISLNDEHYVALTPHYFCEKNVAHKIEQLRTYPKKHTFDLDGVYAQLREPLADGLCLNEDQQRSIMAALCEPITVITGGPGTGKTTLIKSLLQALEKNKKRYKLAAPTGRAAKRITQSTGRIATTLHHLLEFDPSSMSFVRNESYALPLDFLIVDEASMIDIFLAHALLKAMPFGAHLIFIGDVDQLPSVGAGNFLHDLIASEKVPTTRLTKIFRQAQDSLIIINAHRINQGEFPQRYVPDAKRDFLFIKEDNPEAVPGHLEHIYRNGLPKWNIAPDSAITLVPMNRGSVGTQKLNHDLQQILNPQETEKKVVIMGNTFKPRDRVMQIRNNYDKNVFNGDIGTIQDIKPGDRELTVLFDNHSVVYDFGELDELVHAYAISIHKSQGSEYAAVIIPLFTQHFTLLQRNLVYTAITRAKKLCIFIGQTRAIAMAIKNTKGTKRTTFLSHYLTSNLSCRQ